MSNEELDEYAVTAKASARLVRDASRFDVIVTTNMFGDILSDLASELSGSIGLAASLNVGERFAMAQAQHGSAPDLAGLDVANPSSLIGSAAMLLGWIGERRGAPRFTAAMRAIETALDATIAEPRTRTRDMGGLAGTAAFTASVIGNLAAVPGTEPSAGPKADA